MPSASEDPWADLADAMKTHEAAMTWLGERIERRRARRRRQLQCVECGRLDDGRECRWTLRLDCDGDLAAFCTTRDEREFG